MRAGNGGADRRRLIVWNLMTLDGRFEGSKRWAIDWHQQVWGEELEAFSLEQAGTADLLLFGRITYEGMAAYWRTATGDVAEFMNAVPKVVASRTLASADWDNTRVIGRDVEQEVARLRNEAGRDMYIFGSGQLTASLLRAGLIDEVRIGLVPLVLGAGTSLFGSSSQRLQMKFLDARPLQTGCVILRYRPEYP